MGFILPVLSAISLAVSVGSKIAEGRAAVQEAEVESEALTGEAEAIGEQADLAQAENVVEAERVKKQDNRFLARQKLAFMKGGVTLEGSPLLILEETQQEIDKEFKATIKAGEDRRGFAQKKATQVEAQATRVESAGRGRLFGSLASAASTGISGLIVGSKVGLFSRDIKKDKSGKAGKP